MSRSRIYPWISRTLCAIFVKLHPKFPLSETMCITYNWATQTQGQCQTSSSWIHPSVCVNSVYPEPFGRFSFNFTQMFIWVRRCAELMTQLRSLQIKVTLQDHGIYTWILCFVSIKSPQSFIRFSFNITQMFLSVIWCAEPMTVQTQRQGYTSMSCDYAAGIWLSFRLLSFCVFHSYCWEDYRGSHREHSLFLPSSENIDYF